MYPAARKEADNRMICPSCGDESCLRSHRRGIGDWLVTVAALRPWRCMKCKSRFYGRTAAVAFFRHPRCPRCGNLELRRIAKQWVEEGKFRLVFRMLNVPAYRCDPCRHRFFSFRSVYGLRAAAKRDAVHESATADTSRST